ncbi:MAG: lysophospholipid acyltransferase family protein [Candidatus Omnitrophica bacterium]|nr:lysophospholipid acyltransferase family protein [Candidatus Omnitrophota bacterium]
MILTPFVDFILILLSFLAWVYVITWTAFCYVITIVLLFYCILFDHDCRIEHAYATFWAKWLVWTMPIWKVKVVGKSNIGKGPYVFISNHQSLGDILCLYFIDRQFKFVAKKILFDAPFLGWGMRLMRYVPLERGDKKSAGKSFRLSSHFLKNGISIMMFPEGTRSPDGRIGHFKRGAFRLAIQNKAPIVPIVISGTRNAVKKGEWFFRRQAKVTISIGKPVKVDLYTLADSNVLRERLRNEMIEKLAEIEK